MKKQTKKKSRLTKRDVELLDKVICGLARLRGLLPIGPARSASDLYRKFSRQRDKERDRFRELFVPLHHYSYGVKFLSEYIRIISRFVNNKRLGNEYDKRRMRCLLPYVNGLLNRCREEMVQ